MIKLTPLELTLLDGVETEQFGYVRFLTVKDLLEIKEKRYNDIIRTFAQSVKAYDLNEKIRDFDLFFFNNNGKRMELEEGVSLLDSFLFSISVIYGINQEDVVVNELSQMVEFTTKEGYNVTIHRGNYDDLAMIVLSSCMCKKIQKEKEIEFKTDNKDLQEKYLKFKQQSRELDRKNATTMAMIVSNVMISYKLITDKNSIINMSIYNLLFAYSATGAINSWDMNFRKYLAGADPKDMNMEHWTVQLNNIIKQEE